MDRALERIDGHMERGNVLMDRNNELHGAVIEQFELNRKEFELNREVQYSLASQAEQRHHEVMARLEDLGIHLREQTQALIAIRAEVRRDDPPT
jgi:hypothetical protein